MRNYRAHAVMRNYPSAVVEPKTIGKLTALAIARAKCRDCYGHGGGLFLQVSVDDGPG